MSFEPLPVPNKWAISDYFKRNAFTEKRWVGSFITRYFQT